MTAHHDVTRLVMHARDMFVVAALVVPCSLSLAWWSFE